MKLTQAIAAKDQMTKQALYELFSDDKDIIEKIELAFADGHKNWNRHLKVMFGKEEVDNLSELLGKDITKELPAKFEAVARGVSSWLKGTAKYR